MTTTVVNIKISAINNKIPDTITLVTTTVLNTKIGQLKNIPDQVKYVTTQEFNKLTAENFAARLKQANLVSKTDFDNKLISFNREIILNNTKYLQVLNSLTTKDYNFSQVEFILQLMIIWKRVCLSTNTDTLEL